MIQQSEISQFGKPTGSKGEEVGRLMADENGELNSWAISLLGDTTGQNLLEIGYGPGVAIRELIQLGRANFIAGIDHSEVMYSQAAARNAGAIQDGRLELKLGSVSELPYQDEFFDKAFTVNSFHFWADPLGDLAKVQRTIKPSGLIAITTQPRWATSEQMVDEVGSQFAKLLLEAGFGAIRVEKRHMDPMSAVCVLGMRK